MELSCSPCVPESLSQRLYFYVCFNPVKDYEASKAEETKMLGVSMIGLSTFTTSMGATKRCAHNEVNGAAFVGAFV